MAGKTELEVSLLDGGCIDVIALTVTYLWLSKPPSWASLGFHSLLCMEQWERDKDRGRVRAARQSYAHDMRKA